jgi:hypothetical protein
MLNGLDSIGLTLQHEEAISDYEQAAGVYELNLLPGHLTGLFFSENEISRTKNNILRYSDILPP